MHSIYVNVSIIHNSILFKFDISVVIFRAKSHRLHGGGMENLAHTNQYV